MIWAGFLGLWRGRGMREDRGDDEGGVCREFEGGTEVLNMEIVNIIFGKGLRT